MTLYDNPFPTVRDKCLDCFAPLSISASSGCCEYCGSEILDGRQTIEFKLYKEEAEKALSYIRSVKYTCTDVWVIHAGCGSRWITFSSENFRFSIFASGVVSTKTNNPTQIKLHQEEFKGFFKIMYEKLLRINKIEY